MEWNTKRLTMRPWRESDAEALYACAKDPRVGPAAGWPPHQSVEESREVIRSILSGPEAYAICQKGTDLPIGCVELMIGEKSHLHLPASQGEIGYWLGAEYWGQGFMPEAVCGLLRRAFEELRMDAVWCSHDVTNQKSGRVQEKCGFRYHHTDEAVYWPLVDEYCTDRVNCITKEQWEADQASKQE